MDPALYLYKMVELALVMSEGDLDLRILKQEDWASLLQAALGELDETMVDHSPG